MMETRLHTQLKAAPRPSFSPVRGGVLQRQCACGGSSGLATECEECGKKGKVTARPDAANSTSADAASISHHGLSGGHDFSRVRVQAGLRGTSSRSVNFDGPAASGSASGSAGVFIDGPEKETPSKPAAPKPAPPPKAPAQPACPTNVEMINIDQLNDTELGKNGKLTGTGAVAYMQVSGAGRTDWDGTTITEKVRRTSNSCGDWARRVCSNESGESGGFKVGAGINALGKIKMPAFMNTFYDMHIFTHDVSVLHQLDKSGCEVTCQQCYLCGGKQFGPEFVITYSTKKDTIANYYDVTRVTVKKEPKAAPATP
jgi:hypothetical protein